MKASCHIFCSVQASFCFCCESHSAQQAKSVLLHCHLYILTDKKHEAQCFTLIEGIAALCMTRGDPLRMVEDTKIMRKRRNDFRAIVGFTAKPRAPALFMANVFFPFIAGLISPQPPPHPPQNRHT
jgi:hypothetical protein